MTKQSQQHNMQAVISNLKKTTKQRNAKRGCKDAAAEETNSLFAPWSSQKNKQEAAGRFVLTGEK